MSANRVLMSIISVIVLQYTTNAATEDEEYLLSYKATYVMKNWDGTDMVPSYNQNLVSAPIADTDELNNSFLRQQERSYSAPEIFIFTERTQNDIPIVGIEKPAMFLFSDFILDEVMLYSSAEIEQLIAKAAHTMIPNKAIH